MPKPLKFALVAAVVLVLGISAQSTVATWRAVGNIDAGKLNTGTLALHAGNVETSVQDYNFTELNGVNLMPGAFVQAPLTLSNAGTSKLRFGLTEAEATPQSANASDAALIASANLSIYAGMSPSACSGSQNLSGQKLYSGPLGSAASLASLRSLAPQGDDRNSETLCVRVGIDSSAPQKASGGRMNLVLRFGAEQE